MRIAKAVLVERDAGESDTWPGAGFGARSLLPIANRPVVLHALEQLRGAGVRSVLVAAPRPALGALRTAVREGATALSVDFVDAPPGTGVAGALQLAEGFVGDEPFIVQESDALLRADLAALAQRFAAGRLDALALRLVTAADAGNGARNAATLAPLAGSFLAPGACRGVSDPSFGLPEVLARLRRAGGRVAIEREAGSLPCRGGHAALLEANRQALEHLHPEPVAAFLHRTELQGPVVVDPTARLENTLVRGPAVIGPRAELSHAYVGPYTAIGADVVVEGSEVEYSVLLQGARVSFLSGRLEGSVLGRGATIGRDHRLPHAVRLIVPDGAEITLS